MQNDPNRHHFLPVFYLKQWVGPDGRLTQYSRPYREVKPLRRHPNAIGYIKRLYAVAGLSDDQANAMEREFLSPVDSRAADALACMKASENTSALTSAQRLAWSEFISSLLTRMPDDIEKLRGAMQSSANIILSLFQDAWEIFRDDIGPQTVQELLGDDTEKIASEKTIQFVRDIVRHPKFSDGIGALEWQLRTLKDARHDLLTSDRPVTYTRPLEGPQAHLVVPVGPQTLFIAARPEAMKQLMAVRDDAMATVANMSAVQNASSYVFGTSDSQLRFVQNRFGSSREQTIMDQSLVLVENLRREFEGVKLPIDLGVLKKMAEPFVQARRLAELE